MPGVFAVEPRIGIRGAAMRCVGALLAAEIGPPRFALPTVEPFFSGGSFGVKLFNEVQAAISVASTEKARSTTAASLAAATALKGWPSGPVL